MAPATRLPPEGELAALMGVSRGSLREAVRVLAHLGIVDVRVGDGTYVTDLGGANLLRGFNLVSEVANEKDRTRDLRDPPRPGVRGGRDGGFPHHR